MYQRCPAPDNCMSCQWFAAQLGAYGPLTEESARIRDEGVRAFIAALKGGRNSVATYKPSMSAADAAALEAHIRRSTE